MIKKESFYTLTLRRKKLRQDYQWECCQQTACTPDGPPRLSLLQTQPITCQFAYKQTGKKNKKKCCFSHELCRITWFDWLIAFLWHRPCKRGRTARASVSRPAEYNSLILLISTYLFYYKKDAEASTGVEYLWFIWKSEVAMGPEGAQRAASREKEKDARSAWACPLAH